MAGGHGCGLRSQDTAETQGSDIQEHHPTGSFIRQRMLAGTISAHSGASRHENEEDATLSFEVVLEAVT